MIHGYTIIRQTDILEFLAGSLRAPALARACLNPKTTIGQIASHLAEGPLITRSIDDEDSIETELFYSWLGVLPIRDRGDVFQNDMGLVHETLHLHTLRGNYDSRRTHEAWSRHLMLDEIATSLYTDVLFYFEFQNLRTSLDIPEIYADPFLTNRVLLDPNYRENQRLFNANRRAFVTKMCALAEAEETHPFSTLPPPTQRELLFLRTNRIYAEVWRSRFQEVEAAVEKYYRAVRERCSWAPDSHVDWLISQSNGGIPFREEASKFSKAFREVFSVEETGVLLPSDYPMTRGVTSGQFAERVLSFLST